MVSRQHLEQQRHNYPYPMTVEPQRKNCYKQHSLCMQAKLIPAVRQVHSYAQLKLPAPSRCSRGNPVTNPT